MYACICHAVTKDEMRDAISQGATDPVTIARETKAGTGCGACLKRTCRLLDRLGISAAAPECHDEFMAQVEAPAPALRRIAGEVA